MEVGPSAIGPAGSALEEEITILSIRVSLAHDEDLDATSPTQGMKDDEHGCVLDAVPGGDIPGDEDVSMQMD